MDRLRTRQIWLPAALLLGLMLAYANHFQNGFHFDDAHTVVDNPSIRSLSNVPRFFTDATTFSVLPANRTYRPLVSSTLALDYALAGGYKPFFFHLSTFLVYVLLLGGVYLLFSHLLAAAWPQSPSASQLTAWAATAIYGLHPAMAETVNYIIQRGDVYAAAGVVLALATYLQWPQLRRYGLYLLPFALGLLSKPPAVVFPVLLLLAVYWFEPRRKPSQWAWILAPSLAVTVALLKLQAAMTPKSYLPTTASATHYLLTQPYVLFRYFGSFFVPAHLNVDSDLTAFTTMNGRARLGFFFVATLLSAVALSARRTRLRPVAYGLAWFLIASLPTSLYPLSEVENDHRMFLPFVGLSLAMVSLAALVVEHLARRSKLVRPAAALALIAVLASAAYGTHVRNRVWRSDESLWQDDVQKSPGNGRGWMNYGLTQMARGSYPEALTSFERALPLTPNYPTLEINLGIVLGAMQQPLPAEAHFVRAMALAPNDDQPHFFYGRWLYQTGRFAEALRQLQSAIALNPDRPDAYPFLALARQAIEHPSANDANAWINASLAHYQRGDYPASIDAARHALQLNPHSALAFNNIGAAEAALGQWKEAIASEEAALRLDPTLQIAKNNLALYTRNARLPAQATTADDWLNASLRDYQNGLYAKGQDDARQALRLKPNSAEAYNNIAACAAALGQWDAAIDAAQQAIRLKPDFQLAKNNLAWAQQQKRLGAR